MTFLKRHSYGCLAIPYIYCFVLIALIQCNSVESAKLETIFDGTTFSGWEGPKEFFRIEDSAIVAGSLDKEIPVNQFLCTEEAYDDFELQMQVKFTARDNNAGIQFRTKRIPDHHEVIGYQADVGWSSSRVIWGSLYDESRRKKFLVEPDEELIDRILKPDDWNDYLIRCEGPVIRFWMNSELILEYVEEDQIIPSSGKICVQIHSGVPSEAWYRNIKIRRIKR